MRLRALSVRAVVAASALALTGCTSSAHHRASATTVTSATTAPSTTTPSATTAAPTTIPVQPTFHPPAGGPVPAGFGANSATFISDTEGWVLDSAPCSF